MMKSNKGGTLNVWSRFALIILFVLLGAGAEAQDVQADKKSAGKAPDQVTYGALRGGVTSVLVPQRLADDKALQQKYGLEVKVRIFANTQDLYPAMVRGDYNATFVPASSLATQAVQGIPVQVIATAEPDKSVVLLGKGDKIVSADQLRGRRITALAAAGVWLSMQAQMDQHFGLKAKKDYEVVSVNNLGSGAAQVVAGTADYALAWEPFTTASMVRMPGLHVVLSADELKKYKSWRLVIGVHGNMPDDVKIRQTRALAEAAAWLQKNPAQADKDYRELIQLEAGIIEKVLSGTTNPIDIHPLTAEDVGALHNDLELVVDQGGLKSLPDKKSFYYYR
jgi:ABC-type nitrate/sulfonate/bicarbonate transport system substrate-binding protein